MTSDVPERDIPDGGVDDRLKLVDSLSHQFIRFGRLVKRTAVRFSQTDGVEFAAYGLLATVMTEGPMRTTALAEAVHADPSTVSRQTAALVRHGLLERRADPVDGRASLLAVSPEGERVFQSVRAHRNMRMAAVLADWPRSDVLRLVALLDRLNSDFEAYDRTHQDDAPAGVASGGPDPGPQP